ncbi:TonB family protein [Sphingomonas sp. LR60]|uniref:energy transducer TonB n=1 Tax=Sphingomonas sp. LR60 TaxID=3050233 RepID=UPI002FDFB2C1
MAYANRIDNSRRFTTIAGVAAIHGLIGYVFISGMATSFVHSISKPFITTNIPIETPPPPDVTPPKLEKVTPRQSSVAPPRVTVTPIVPTQQSTDTFVLVDTPTLPPLASGNDGVTVDQPATIAAVSKASGVLARGNRNDWITTDDYPPSAIRAEEEGVVGIALRINAEGRIDPCSVTASSGHASLDQATCRLYQRRARFTPAHDDAGAPVTATFTDRIRWQLPR